MKRRSDLVDITGVKFNKWTVLKYDESKSINRKSYWICRCECGTIRSVRVDNLKKYQSCGCHKKQLLKNRVKHGQYNTRLYKVWIGMKQRCDNKNNIRYTNYGGRGIKVCESWYDYSNFYNWAIANGYVKGLTIDRINNNGDYKPDNCRFISNEVQQLNKSNNRLVTINNITMTIKEWCVKYGINRNTFVYRLNNGWLDEKLLS